MILPFKPQFVDRILDGSKIHTFREDTHDRWKPGRKIHAATGVRSKNYNCFFESECVSTQEIEIKYKGISYVEIFIDNFLYTFLHMSHQNNDTSYYFTFKNNLRLVQKLSENDGFDSVKDFFGWFNKDFKGKIIHWTDFRY